MASLSLDESSTSSVEVNNYKTSDKSLRDLNDIMAADAEDESLRKYKESLLGAAIRGDRGDINDPRKLIISEYRVIFSPDENLPEIVHHLDTPQVNKFIIKFQFFLTYSTLFKGVSRLQTNGITLREGVKFKFRISFRVQHEILVGIKFVNKLSKMMFSDTEELVLGNN